VSLSGGGEEVSIYVGRDPSTAQKKANSSIKDYLRKAGEITKYKEKAEGGFDGEN